MKLRIGVMGAASIAKRMMMPAINSLPDIFTLVGISSREQEKALEFSTLFNTTPIVGYDNLIDRSDIDVIYMPLPTGLHEEWIEKSLLAGKHVLVEKSLAMNFVSASRLVELARKKGLLLVENFMFKYHSQHQYTRKLLSENQLGEIRLFRSQFGFPPLDSGNFRYDKKAGGGSLLDAGAYTVKASQWFLGYNLKVLSSALYYNSDTSVDIFGNASLINDKGIVSQVSFGFDNNYKCNYEFWGSRAYLKALKAFTPKPGEEPSFTLDSSNGSEIITQKADNHFQNILIEFHRAIMNKDYDEHYEEILDQSRILTDIERMALKIKL